MDAERQSPGMRAGSRDVPPVPAPVAGSSGDPVSFLLGRGAQAHRDSRRITAGLAVLAVLAVALVNVGVYQNAQSHLVPERWSQLTAGTEMRRDQVHDLAMRLRNEAGYVVEQPHVRSAILGLSGRDPSAARASLRAVLDRAASRFRFRSVHLFDVRGRSLLAGFETDAHELARLSDLARQTGQGGVNLEAWTEGSGQQALGLALPVTDDAGRTAAIVAFGIHVQDMLPPAFSIWPGFGRSAGAYLVRKQGTDVQYLSTPPGNSGMTAGDRVAESARSARAAAMAVEGVETSILLADADGRLQAVTTRSLPDLGWGIVGQADRSELTEGMRVTVYGLLVFDIALLLLAGIAFWLWRRQYKYGLAQREREVTHRHAERVRAVFDTAFDTIVTFDVAGRVRSVNRAADRTCSGARLPSWTTSPSTASCSGGTRGGPRPTCPRWARWSAPRRSVPTARCARSSSRWAARARAKSCSTRPSCATSASASRPSAASRSSPRASRPATAASRS